MTTVSLERMRVGHRASVGGGDVSFAQILDAGLKELGSALAALAEHLAEIAIAPRRGRAGRDVI